MPLKYIYIFFIGILLATFVGVGIAAFYEAPKMPEFSVSEIIPIKQQLAPIPATQGDAPAGASQSAEKAQQELEQAILRENTYREYQQATHLYSRNVSIITTVASVLVLIMSLTVLKKLDVLSDGLLLGGLFTQLYSIVRGFESQDNKFRFVVVAIGLIASLIVGYIKFVSRQEPIRRHGKR